MKKRKKVVKIVNLDALAKCIGKIMDKMPFTKSNCNNKVYCSKCRNYYCLGFDGVDAYCFTCFYTNSCTKETTGYRTCIKCGGPR